MRYGIGGCSDITSRGSGYFVVENKRESSNLIPQSPLHYRDDFEIQKNALSSNDFLADYFRVNTVVQKLHVNFEVF